MGRGYQLQFRCVCSWAPPLLLVYRLPPDLREHCPSWRWGHYGVNVLKKGPARYSSELILKKTLSYYKIYGNKIHTQRCSIRVAPLGIDPSAAASLLFHLSVAFLVLLPWVKPLDCAALELALQLQLLGIAPLSLPSWLHPLS